LLHSVQNHLFSRLYKNLKEHIKLSLCLTKHHYLKTYGEAEVYLHSFLNYSVCGSEWSASRADHFIPRERAHCTHWLGGWVVLRASTDAVAKRKKSLHFPCWELKARRPARSLHTIWS